MAQVLGRQTSVAELVATFALYVLAASSLLDRCIAVRVRFRQLAHSLCSSLSRLGRKACLSEISFRATLTLDCSSVFSLVIRDFSLDKIVPDIQEASSRSSTRSCDSLIATGKSFVPGQTRMTVACHCSTRLTYCCWRSSDTVVELTTVTFCSAATYKAAIPLDGLQSDQVVDFFENRRPCPFLGVLIAHRLIAQRASYVVWPRGAQVCINAVVDARLAHEALSGSTMKIKQAC